MGKSQPRIREQALQILLMLLERPRDLVTREELRDRLWSSDTFVDFDHGLNTAINQLRSALGDSAANPRFIQTLPRRGYRFIAPVEIMPNLSPRIAHDPTAADIGSSDRSEGTASQDSRSSILSDARELPSVSRRLVLILFSLIQVMYLTFYIVALTRVIPSRVNPFASTNSISFDLDCANCYGSHGHTDSALSARSNGIPLWRAEHQIQETLSVSASSRRTLGSCTLLNYSPHRFRLGIGCDRRASVFAILATVSAAHGFFSQTTLDRTVSAARRPIRCVRI